MTEELPKLPDAPWVNDRDGDLYTVQMMRAYGAECMRLERERCAKRCDAEVVRLTAEMEPRAALVAGICAAAVRGGYGRKD